MITSFDEVAADLPTEILGLCQAYIDQIALFDERIGALDHEIKGRAKTDEATSRLMTVPGVGPICATTIQAFAPPMEKFSNGREFAVLVRSCTKAEVDRWATNPGSNLKNGTARYTAIANHRRNGCHPLGHTERSTT